MNTWIASAITLIAAIAKQIDVRNAVAITKAWVFGSSLMAAEIEDSLWSRTGHLSTPWGETSRATFELYEQGAKSGRRLSSLQEAVRRRAARRGLATRGLQVPALQPVRAGRARERRRRRFFIAIRSSLVQGMRDRCR